LQIERNQSELAKTKLHDLGLALKVCDSCNWRNEIFYGYTFYTS